jgi:signal transduction histidine kinase
VTRSLRARFAALAVLTAVMAAIGVGAAVQGLFERHVERKLLAELDADLRFLARSVVVENGTARLSVQPLPDPRFQEPLSGLYWQVRDDATGAVLRSPSMAGHEVPLQPDQLAPGERHRHIIIGPEGTKLIVLERRIEEPSAAAAPIRVAVAMDRKVMAALNRAFVLDLLPLLASIAAALMAAFALQGAIALRPIARARQALQALRAGQRDRLGEALPSELQGLADDFDALLATQREGTRRARERAADLAHGLRTPLALLGVRARALRAQGQAESAAAIEEIAAGMDARVSRELARAQIRGAAPHGPAVALAPAVERVARALEGLTAARQLTWRRHVPPDLAVRLDAADLLELLGTLLENAAKWARADVCIAALAEAEAVMLLVEDDGPGIPAPDRAAALARGGRLDPDRSGTGLGLAIAEDIAAAYGGALLLEEGAAGGLRVRVRLPGLSHAPDGGARPRTMPPGTLPG